MAVENYGGRCYMESHKRWKKTEQERWMREKGGGEENNGGGATGSVHENNIMGEAISRTLRYTQRIRLLEKNDHFYT
jgi:hypothetical protein